MARQVALADLNKELISNSILGVITAENVVLLDDSFSFECVVTIKQIEIRLPVMEVVLFSR